MLLLKVAFHADSANPVNVKGDIFHSLGSTLFISFIIQSDYSHAAPFKMY